MGDWGWPKLSLARVLCRVQHRAPDPRFLVGGVAGGSAPGPLGGLGPGALLTVLFSFFVIREGEPGTCRGMAAPLAIESTPGTLSRFPDTSSIFATTPGHACNTRTPVRRSLTLYGGSYTVAGRARRLAFLLRRRRSPKEKCPGRLAQCMEPAIPPGSDDDADPKTEAPSRRPRSRARRSKRP